MLKCQIHTLFVSFLISYQVAAYFSTNDTDQREPNRTSRLSNRKDLFVSKNSTRQRFPDAIIIGVKKCGTRALLEFLKVDPKIRTTGPEVHFFDKNFARGYDWYRSQMPFTKEDQLTIEKSPAYFISPKVPERVYSLNPHMKLMLVVRNPITRAISDYTQAVTRKKRSILPTNTFEDMSWCNSINSTKCKNGINYSWGAIKIGIYHRYLKPWLKYFPISQFLFVDGERLIKSPAEEIRRAERFLGLDPVVTAKDFVQDPIKGFPCVRRVNSSRPRCLGKSKGRQHPTVNKDFIKRLQDFYRPENEAFFRLINQYFHWY